MKEQLKLGVHQMEELAVVGKALSSPIRIEMLRILEKNHYNVNELAEMLEIPASSAAMHVRVLEESGLIQTELKPAVRGSMKICKKTVGTVFIDLEETEKRNYERINMPVGNYVDYHVEPTCGIVSREGYIDVEDEPAIFYHPKRSEAKLIWLGKGYLEYRFPNAALKKNRVKEMEISAELCSEDHEYHLDFPSDITLWINGKEAGTWRSPGDFGGRRGKLNPAWWPDQNTQYGILKRWKVDETGTYLDEEQISAYTLSDYELGKRDYISVKFGIKEDAKAQGGMNLFGDQFGDYPQDIVMQFLYE